MLGSRLGSRIAFLGSAIGSTSDDEGANSTGPAAAKDATSGIYVPANATEWGSVLSTAGITSGGPSFLWLMQDTASPESEVMGTGVTLATSGTAGTFAAAVSGWSRKGWQSAGDGVTSRLLSTSTSLPNPASASALMLGYIAILTPPAAQRQALFAIGGSSTTGARAEVTTTPAIVGIDDSNSVTGTANMGAVVRPVAIKYDRTNSVCTVYTNQEKVSPTFAAGSGQALVVGYTSTTSPNMWCGYLTLFTGSAAELTDAQVRSLLQTLGWTVGW